MVETMTKEEAGKSLGVNPNTIGSWAERGLLKKVGDKISAESVNDLQKKLTENMGE